MLKQIKLFYSLTSFKIMMIIVFRYFENHSNQNIITIMGQLYLAPFSD